VKFNMKIISKTTEKIKGFAKTQLELSSLTFRQKNYKPQTTHINAYNKLEVTEKFIEINQNLYGEKDQFFDRVFVFTELNNWHAMSVLRANLETSKTSSKTPLHRALSVGVHGSPIGYSLPRVDSVDTCVQAGNSAKKQRWIIGFDTEYQAMEAEGINNILSTQLWLPSLGVGITFIHQAGKRTSISQITSLLVNYLGLRVGKATTKKHIFTYVAHFNIAEFASFSEKGRKELLVYNADQHQFSETSNVEVLRKSVVSLNSFEIKIVTPKTASSRKSVGVMCDFRDTALIQPTSLRKIGKSINLPKFDVNDDIEKMSELMANDLNLFLEYGIRDAHITAVYYSNFCDIVAEFGIDKIPLTSSGLGVEYVKAKLDKEAFKQAMGGKLMYYTRAGKTKEQSKGYLRAKIEYSPHLTPWKDVYHGGRNECFMRDLDQFAQTWDYDLCNAYPTAMLRLCIHDVDKKYPQKYSDDWKNEIKPTDQGMVKIRFVCHDWVQYPPFSWEDPEGKGLIHMLEGEIEVTTIELWAAMKNGLLKHVELIDSLFYPSKGESPIVPLIVELIAIRTSLKATQPLKAEMLKLIVNSIYGKYAQGLKRVGMPQSAITNPAIAAQITGIVRACIAEQMNFLASNNHEIISVTTDGYSTKQEITSQQMDQIKQLPISSLLSQARVKANLGDTILELKHQGSGFFAFRTRCYGQFIGDKLLFAKGGVKIDADTSNLEKFKYLNKVAKQGWNTEKSLTPKSDVYKKGKDLVTYVKEKKRTLLDLDYKRKHIFTQDKATKFVYITTRPYQNLAEYQKEKSIYERIYARQEPIFKARNLHHNNERFQAFYLLQAIYRELPDDYRFQSLSDFLVEARLDDYVDMSVREVAKATGKSKSVINKWRNNRQIRLQDFSKGLQALIADLSLDNPPF
jgi:hypothetical protein